MRAMLNKLHQYLQTQEEQTLRLAVYAVLLIILVILLQLTVRSHAFFTNSRHHFNAQLVQLNEIESQANVVTKLRESSNQSNVPASGESLMLAVTAAAETYQLKVSRYQPDEDSGIQLWLANSEVNAIMKWIDTLQTQQQVDVLQMSLTGTDAPGYGNLQIHLRVSQ